jgi:hypothetical protein
MTVELTSKRFELLSDLIPQAVALALLMNQTNVSAERMINGVQETARAMRLMQRWPAPVPRVHPVWPILYTVALGYMMALGINAWPWSMMLSAAMLTLICGQMWGRVFGVDILDWKQVPDFFGGCQRARFSRHSIEWHRMRLPFALGIFLRRKVARTARGARKPPALSC